MNPQLTKPQWVSYPQSIREKLREIFKIPKSEGCEVCNNMLVSDGSSHQDLQAISVASMQEYLKTDEDDFKKLFDAVLAIIDPQPIYVVEDGVPVTPEIVTIPEEQVEEFKEEVPASTIPEELQAVIDAAAPKNKKKPAPIPSDVKEILENRSLNANQNKNEQTKETSSN